LPVPELDNEIGSIPDPVRTILQDVDTSPTSATRIVYIDEVPKDGDAAFIKEGTLKPAVSVGWKTAYSDVKKVAETIKISNEMLEDIDFVTGEVESLARRVVETKIAQEILNGNGVDPRLKGVIMQVGGFITPAYANSVINPNTADVLMCAASQIRDLGYTGQITAYLNSSEISKMKLIKDANGNYMSFGTVLEGITIKANPDLGSGQFLIGDFSKIHVRIKKDLTLDWGYGTVTDSNGDVKSDWEMNFITLRCEARLAEYIKENDLKAFVYDNIATVAADIAE
jgi:HK97 family phage major capsid protein